jgi:hypothetical protein
MPLSRTTKDPEEIRRWAEARGAVPAEVASTESDIEPGILRFKFPKAPRRNDAALKDISWDDFFRKFQENDLEMVYQEKTAAGRTSNFNKLIHPSSEKRSSASRSSSSKSGSSRGSSHRSSHGNKAA